MNDFSILLIKKNGQYFYYEIESFLYEIIMSDENIWSEDWDKFQNRLTQLGIETKTTKASFVEKEVLYINWDSKEIYKIMDRFYFDGFYIANLMLEINNNIIFNNKDIDYYPIESLINNFKKGNINQIDCYYYDNKRKKIDFWIKLNKNADSEELLSFIRNYSSIEKKPQMLKIFNMSLDIKTEEIIDKEISIVKFPIKNKHWKIKDYKINFTNYLKIAKEINQLINKRK
tara:strand:- start:5441 stop:6130 length:690 start_codon:yes stop_codon:yes gene_type:complete